MQFYSIVKISDYYLYIIGTDIADLLTIASTPVIIQSSEISNILCLEPYLLINNYHNICDCPLFINKNIIYTFDSKSFYELIETIKINPFNLITSVEVVVCIPDPFLADILLCDKHPHLYADTSKILITGILIVDNIKKIFALLSISNSY